jgi:hypothetical protein
MTMPPLVNQAAEGEEDDDEEDDEEGGAEEAEAGPADARYCRQLLSLTACVFRTESFGMHHHRPRTMLSSAAVRHCSCMRHQVTEACGFVSRRASAGSQLVCRMGGYIMKLLVLIPNDILMRR